MIERVKTWVNNKLALGEFSSRRQVMRRSAVMAGRIAALACTMVVAAHWILEVAGMLPYDLIDALVIGIVVTLFVSLTVAFAAYYVVGLAVYDLTVSRAEFERLSRTDSLTGLLNRRAFLEAFQAAVSPASLAILDIDRFKSINDTLGHVAGDEVIVAVARELEQLSGGRHIVSRIGGEEFAVLFCDVAPEQTMRLVEETCARIQGRTVVSGAREIAVTVSAGVADHRRGRSFDDLFTHADRALYLAKVSGRNCAVHEREVERLSPPARNQERSIADPDRNAAHGRS